LLRLQILGKFIRGGQSARMWHEFLYAVGVSVAAMFPIVNPLGHAPMFFAMTVDEPAKFRRAQALKTSLWVTAIPGDLSAARPVGARILWHHAG
jgi:hypothetical protein